MQTEELMKMEKDKIIIITGATGSGKSKFAVELAKEINGVVINADSMQIYKQIPIISAQPSVKSMQNINHYLYGFVDIFDLNDAYSVGRYLDDLRNVVKKIKYNDAGKTPIIVGGTMLYIDAIINGLSKIPEVKKDVKEYVEHKFSQKSTSEIFDELKKIDEKYAEVVDKNNPQRLIRAIEVKLSTGMSIMDFWQLSKEIPIFCEYEMQKMIIDIQRDVLYERINNRFDEMIKNGALNEALIVYENCIKNGIDCRKLPKAIGLHEFFDFFEEKTSLEMAISNAKQYSRNYAKRQLTWFRRRFKDFAKVNINF